MECLASHRLARAVRHRNSASAQGRVVQVNHHHSMVSDRVVPAYHHRNTVSDLGQVAQANHRHRTASDQDQVVRGDREAQEAICAGFVQSRRMTS